VPIETTIDMRRAGHVEMHMSDSPNYVSIYKAMIAAAQEEL